MKVILKEDSEWKPATVEITFETREEFEAVHSILGDFSPTELQTFVCNLREDHNREESDILSSMFESLWNAMDRSGKASG